MKRKSLNAQRAKRCANVLFDYGTDNTLTGCLTDFLTDARHWCDRNGESFARLDRLAHQHYLAEIDEERSQS